MAKKFDKSSFGDINIPQAAMQGFITIFRQALNGDKNAVKVANMIMNSWEKRCGDFIDAYDLDDEPGVTYEMDDDKWDEEEEPMYEHPTLPRPDVSEYHLRIQLIDTDVKIWRELKVPSNVELDFLGHLLVDLMGWEDVHLFQFVHNKLCYTDEESADTSLRGNVRLFSDYTLSDLLKAEGDKMMFEYDFGDCWRHDVCVKGIRSYKKREKPRIEFVDGKGKCPPEDCGGVRGYERLLEMVQKKRKSAEDKEELEWYCIDKDFDPNDFDQELGKEIAICWDEELGENL